MGLERSDNEKTVLAFNYKGGIIEDMWRINNNIHIKEYKVFIRPDSEFNVQAELFIKLRDKLEPFGFKVCGEVRIMGEEKFGGARRQKGRLDIAIFKKSNIVCAIEVKNKKMKGWRRQKRKYEDLGIPKLFLCFGVKQIDRVVKTCEEYLLSK